MTDHAQLAELLDAGRRARQSRARGWCVALLRDASPRRMEEGRVAVPLAITHDGRVTMVADLLLSPAEAEVLHAQLCHALDGVPAPADAPDCRRPRWRSRHHA